MFGGVSILMVTFLCSQSRASSPQLFDSFTEAKLGVQAFYKTYAEGYTPSSTKIILFNDTPDNLTYSGSDSWSGRWQILPPKTIPPRKYAAFLHVKTSGSLRGSWGFAQFRNEGYEKIFIGWSSPWEIDLFSSNKIGVEVSPHGHYPEADALAKLPTQARHARTSDPLDTSIMGTAEIVEDTQPTLALFKCIEKAVSLDYA